jgi:hypothetical protein
VTSRIIMVLGLGALTLVAGCSSGSSSGGPSTSPTLTGQPVTPTVTPTPTATVTPSPIPTATVTAPISSTSCQSSHLSVTIGFAQGTAGATYQSVVFTNTGGAPCMLRGYPGVSFVDASGAQIGKPAAHTPGKEKTVTLAPSGQASATLKQPDSGAFPRSSCHQKTANRLKVYPPGQRAALFVNDTAQVCSTGAGRSDISPVAPGSGA